MIRLTQIDALWITPNQSKPKVPLLAEVNEETGQRILTNILFPQKDKGNRPKFAKACFAPCVFVAARTCAI